MLKKSFGFRILILFLLPLLALAYFSYYFISDKFKSLDKTSIYMLSSQMSTSLSQLIHTIQLERGLSVGYAVEMDSGFGRDKLLQQYRATDEAYQKFLYYVRLNSELKRSIGKLTAGKHISSMNKILEKMHTIKEVRKKIQRNELDFSYMIAYYSGINKELLSIIHTLLLLPQEYYQSPIDIYRVQLIMEDAGLERAYLYKQLLTDKASPGRLAKSRELILEQKKLIANLKSNMRPSETTFYEKIIHEDIQKRVQQYRDMFFEKRLDAADAKLWFRISTERIDEFEKLFLTVVKTDREAMKHVFNKAKNSLYVTLLLWVLSIFSFGLLLYRLSKLVKRETKLMEDLRIASYSFDAHEAMTITDPNGTILRVNKAFSRITGYTPEEVIGGNPSLLKSFRHPEEFYAQMWREIQDIGYWNGEIYNKRKNGEIYPERLSITAIRDDQEVITHYIAQFLDISELKEAEKLVNARADFDFLTELPNRKSMTAKLREEYMRAKRHHFYSAFLFIDLDDFKKVNDNFGHAVGDTLLQEVSSRLSLNLREEDYVARISGDEFCIILVEMGRSRERVGFGLGKICQNIVDNISAPYFINNHRVSIGASIGVRIFPDGEEGPNEVITHADAAMYKAKHGGKNRYLFYDEEIEEKINESRKLENEIEKAIEDEAFVFYFQPKVEIASNEIVGAELLIRWEHPRRGLLHPEVFMHAINDSKMISQITVNALKKACHFIRAHRKSFSGTFSINVPARLLSMKDFVELIENTIISYAISPSQIELEILENELIEDFNSIIANIRELKAFGVKFSIDDFGVGYSSISYLKKLPIDSIKIDKQFVLEMSDPASRELIKMIINISKIFGLIVIVEGIENEEQLQLISESGADQYQGYYFSKPLSEEAFKEMIGYTHKDEIYALPQIESDQDTADEYTLQDG